LLFRIMELLEVEMQWVTLIPPDQLDMKGLPPHEAVILRLMEDFATRKASNRHRLFVDVTSLSNIGEGKIRDLTGDVPFPVTFKYSMQRLNKGEIFVKAITQFSICIELNSTSLQLSAPSW